MNETIAKVAALLAEASALLAALTVPNDPPVIEPPAPVDPEPATPPAGTLPPVSAPSDPATFGVFGPAPVPAIVSESGYLTHPSEPWPLPTECPPAAGIRYSTEHPMLFQPISAPTYPSRIAGGRDYTPSEGPNAVMVCKTRGWAWANRGGDWIDANGEKQGSAPWGAVSTPGGVAGPDRYSIDVTDMVNRAVADGRWNALMLRAIKAQRRIAGRFATDAEAPLMDVVYVAGDAETLGATCVAAAAAPGLPIQADAAISLPVFVEFKRPRGFVSQAVLHFTLTDHPGVSTDVVAYLLDPPVQDGAAEYGTGDGIIGELPVLADTKIEDVIDVGTVGANPWAEREYSPEFWGGAADTSKMPYRGLGKIVTAKPGQMDWSIVGDQSGDDGYEPLAPGLGALKIVMPQWAKNDGDVVGYGGTGAANALIHLPPERYGKQDVLHVRYYVRFGPMPTTPHDRLHVYHDAMGSKKGAVDTLKEMGPLWSDLAGKWGIVPQHMSNYGGTSGSAGGNRGYQQRLAWAECTEAVGGPCERGIRPGFHLYDFGPNNPPGHSYAGDQNIYWGQQGPHGGILYENTWYCVETMMRLNSVDLPGVLKSGTTFTVHRDRTEVADGTTVMISKTLVVLTKDTRALYHGKYATLVQDEPHFMAHNGGQQFWSPNGELRAWVDGRLVYESTDRVFRTLPNIASAGMGENPGNYRVPGDLGFAGLNLIWYHGGVTYSPARRVTFYTGLAWGEKYIGPMRGV